MRINNIGMYYKPEVVAMNRKTVATFVKLHKRMVRHAAKQFLRTGSRRDFNRMFRKLTNWYFD